MIKIIDTHNYELWSSRHILADLACVCILSMAPKCICSCIYSTWKTCQDTLALDVIVSTNFIIMHPHKYIHTSDISKFCLIAYKCLLDIF